MAAGVNPYQSFAPRAFWKPAVSELHPLQIADLYTPRFAITRADRIVAAGSCFAQHISRQLKARGYAFIDTEPPPPLLPPELWHGFGYDLYSARYGNVYTARQWLQLIQRAYGEFSPQEPVWEQNGRFYDPFRPGIEPEGFSCRGEFDAMLEFHLTAVRQALEAADVVILTLGLTEAWISRADGAVFPVCPGTLAGTFDDNRYAFHNFSFREVLEDLRAAIEFLRRKNAEMRFLVTVSPVPLTATASGEHVLTASIYSKSVLRAVCGELCAMFDFVDYFPSYELIASHPFKAMFFDPNARTVASPGVDHVMGLFFHAHETAPAAEAAVSIEAGPAAPEQAAPANEQDELVCEEAILEVFAA